MRLFQDRKSGSYIGDRAQKTFTSAGASLLLFVGGKKAGEALYRVGEFIFA